MQVSLEGAALAAMDREQLLTVVIELRGRLEELAGAFDRYVASDTACRFNRSEVDPLCRVLALVDPWLAGVWADEFITYEVECGEVDEGEYQWDPVLCTVTDSVERAQLAQLAAAMGGESNG